MKRFWFVAALASAALSSALAPAQKSNRSSAHKLDYEAVGSPIGAGPIDPQIAAALKLVSTDHIKANITRLVEFHNRSTISSTETELKPGTGVLAAADWIKSQFESYSK